MLDLSAFKIRIIGVQRNRFIVAGAEPIHTHNDPFCVFDRTLILVGRFLDLALHPAALNRRQHTAEPVDIPDQAMVDRYLPRREPRFRLDVNDPHAFGGLVRPDSYMETRWHQQAAMEQAREPFEQIDREWASLFHRRYGAVESYRTENADLVLVTSGTITSTARYVVDRRRAAGEAVGLIKVKMFRPFPTEAHNRQALFASAESALLLGLLALWWRRLARVPRAMLRNPYVMFAVVYAMGFVVAFSSFSNFGILARQRVQVLPLVLAVVLAAAPLARKRRTVRNYEVMGRGA